MPLRQSTLKFGSRDSITATKLPPAVVETTVRRVMSSPIDADTIVVDTTDMNDQLPTPSESATDVSSESSQTITLSNIPKYRSKRVSSTGKGASSDNLKVEAESDHDKTRNLSGRTLVPGKQSDLPESTSGEFGIATRGFPEEHLYYQVKRPKVGSIDEVVVHQEEEEVESVITVQEESEEESEDETIREEKRLARKAKIEENAKKWEQRRKVAEKNATRKSGRTSLLGKANDLLSSIKDTVLGKRSRLAPQEDASKPDTKSSTKIDHLGPASKKQRLDEDAVKDKSPSKRFTTRREKKWLVSGLFAGQPRMFDARLTENKNKRKSKTLEEAQAKDNSILPLPMFAGERLLQHGRDFKLPFDVFSPLPAGQPKPDEWKKVNKNVFVGDAAAEWRTSKFVEHSTCLCNSKTGCDQDCMNRYMYYECDERNCNLGPEECGNRAFEGLKTRSKIGGKYNVGVEVIKTQDRGYGVRSNRIFTPNQIIVEYTGEIVTQEECERRMRTIYKDNECYYLMLFDQNMIIDATRGSIARFVNHSCEPNCRMEKWTVGGKPRMALFAGDRGIMTGEELTYDYNFDPYSQKNVQECRCGAKSCRGVLGPKPKPEAKRPSPENESGKKKDGKLSGAKRKVAEVLEDKKNRLDKKRKIKTKAAKKTRSPVSVKTGKRSPKRTVLVKKVTARKVSLSKPTKVARNDSKLKKALASVKSKAGSLKGRRVVSSSSATEALLSEKKKDKKEKEKEKKKSPTVSRSLSLKKKAKSVTKKISSRMSTTIEVAT